MKSDQNKQAELAARLRKSLSDAGISRQQLARANGVSVQAIGKWLNNGQVARDHLPKIAETLEVDSHWLLTGNSQQGVQHRVSDNDDLSSTETDASVSMSFAERMRQARKTAGLSQTKVASKLGIQPQSVSEWERGKSRPKGARLVDVANLLNIETTWLFNGQGSPYHQDTQRVASGQVLAVEGSAHKSLGNELGRLVDDFISVDRAAQIRIIEFARKVRLE